jgi:hypothetical protein
MDLAGLDLKVHRVIGLHGRVLLADVDQFESKHLSNLRWGAAAARPVNIENLNNGPFLQVAGQQVAVTRE